MKQPQNSAPCNLEIAIIGAGLAGLCAAAKLREAGHGKIAVFEKAASLGGVWRDNRYPNIACDTPIDLYAISFWPGNTWTRNFAPGAEIRQYLQDFAETWGVTPLISFNTEIAGAAWNSQDLRWHITTSRGETCTARFLVWAGGIFSCPTLPKLPGMQNFAGEMLHSTAWNHDVSLDGKTVAVVGAGATAIQIIPYAVQHATIVHNFVRTPSYVMPRPDVVFDEAERGTPEFARKFRERRQEWFDQFEKIAIARFPMNSNAISETEAEWLKYFHSVVTDPHLRKILTPNYRFGCKRPLFSTDYYPAMNRSNVNAVGRGIARVTKTGVIDSAGEEYRVDSIVWATGFDLAHMLGSLRIIGEDGTSLADAWSALPEAYYGTLVKHFPNMFIVNGPNVSGASASEFVEGQVGLIIRALGLCDEQNADIIDVAAETHDSYNAQVQQRTEQSVMVRGNCNSYYRMGQTGRVFTHWPGTMAQFHEAMAKDALAGIRFRAAAHA